MSVCFGWIYALWALCLCFWGLNIIELWEAKNAKEKDDAREKNRGERRPRDSKEWQWDREDYLKKERQVESLNKEIGEGRKSSVESHWTQYPTFNPLLGNKCWPYFFPGLSETIWLNKSGPAALSCSLSINICISLFNYLKHSLRSIYFRQMEVGWAAPSLFKACTAGASRNVGHKALLSPPSSTSFTLAPAPGAPFCSPQTSRLKRHPCEWLLPLQCPLQGTGCSVVTESSTGCQREAEALEAALLSNSACPCRQAAASRCVKWKAAGYRETLPLHLSISFWEAN